MSTYYVPRSVCGARAVSVCQVLRRFSCLLFPVILNLIDPKVFVLKKKWPHQVIQWWFNWIGSGNSHLAALLPMPLKQQARRGIYIWLEWWISIARGNWVAAIQLGKGDAVWNPRGFSRAILSSSTANSKNEWKLNQPTKQAKKAGPVGIQNPQEWRFGLPFQLEHQIDWNAGGKQMECGIYNGRRNL